MSAPKSDTSTIEARKNRLLELLSEGKNQTDAAEILRQENYPADLRTVQRDVRSLRGQWGEANMNQYEALREQQLTRITEKWTEIDNDDTMSGAEKHLAWSRWMRLEVDLTGTAAPSKSIVGHVSGPKLDSLYLDIREVLLDLDEENKQEALQVMREFAKQRKKPVVITAKFITEGNNDANFS
ncbi:MAG TPA: hypothetical protein VJP02_16515 [Candidatus Sulfotelmatobacter sp.]|nr:hypothetical protein [Candidatus Sulfotelmatobacter sp.]